MSSKIKQQVARKGNQNGSIEAFSYERHSILPPPSELERYEQLCPNITNMLMEEFKKQSEHRRELEHTVVTGEVKSAKRGQIFAFIICIVSIITGFILILFDKNIVGLSTILGSLCSILGVFIYGTRSKRKERIEKSKANP